MNKTELKRQARRLEQDAKKGTIAAEDRDELDDATKHDAAKKWAMSAVELSREVGVRREYITRWKQAHPDFPKPRSDGRWLIAEVREWIEANGKGAAGSEELSQKEALEVRRLELLCEGLAFKQATIRKEYLHKDEVHRQITDAAHILRRALRSLKASLASSIPGLSREDAIIEIEKQIDAIQMQLHAEPWINE